MTRDLFLSYLLEAFYRFHLMQAGICIFLADRFHYLVSLLPNQT